MFYSRQTIGYFGKVISTELFLPGKIEGSMIGRHYLQCTTLQAKPPSFIVGHASHRRRTDKLCSFKTRGSIAPIIEIEILRAGFTPYEQIFGAGSGNGLQGIGAT